MNAELLTAAQQRATKLACEGLDVLAISKKLDNSFVIPEPTRIELATKAVNAVSAYKASLAQTSTAVAEPGPSVTESVATEPVVAEPTESEAEYLNPTDTLGYLRRMFLPGDWIDIQLIHQTEKFKDKFGVVRPSAKDHCQFLEKAIEPTTPQQLADLQSRGWNVYVAMNAFTPNVSRRREKDVARVNSVYIELDENGDAGVAKVQADAKAELIPQPHFILRSSPGKYYVIWLVENFDVPTQKALNKALQVRYGSDPASVDAARVLRLPGTRNLKYASTPVVEIIQEAPGDRCGVEEFKIEFDVPKKIDRAAVPEKVQTRMEFYEEACDIAGIGAGELVAKDDGSYSYTVECPDWEEHTNKSKMDGSVWISPSGTISYRCWHSHCADKNWTDFYRPWMETTAKESGFEGKLKFGDASEVEMDGDSIGLAMSETASDNVVVDGNETATPDALAIESSGRITIADIHLQLAIALTGRSGAWQHGWAADFFSMLFGDNYRYAIMGKIGDWMQWNGHMWHPGNVVTMQKRIDYLLQRIRLQIMPTLTDENLRIALRSLEKKCASADFMSGVLRTLQNRLLVNFTDFDPEGSPPLLNFINGTYELETGVFRESRRKDMLTQTLAISYMPNAQCPTWLKFLENSFPDAEVREFLQRFFGYMMEGTGKEKVAAFFHGYGDNGKTMLMAVLTAIFGFKSDNAYGKSVGWETFAENKSGAIRNDIARLHNARAVFCDESEQGMVLKESVFKALTGASPITARFLHKEFFTFFSRFVFVLTTNRLPSVKGGDGASWSRILKIPMTQSFPVGHPKRIEGLKALLMAEREGIASWMVEGYRKYAAEGLRVPQVIKDASAEYRENSDVIESFLTEATERADSNHLELFEQVYSRYSQWCFRNHEREQARDSFIDNLKARGYDSRRKMNAAGKPRFIYGLRLLPEGATTAGGTVTDTRSNNVSFEQGETTT